MLKLYVAGPWVRREDVIREAAKFDTAGFKVISRWFYHEGNPTDATGVTASKERVYQQAKEDIEDINEADWVIIMNLQQSEGKAVETGIAIATGTPFLTIGPRLNIFAVMGEGEFDSTEDAIYYLRKFNA